MRGMTSREIGWENVRRKCEDAVQEALMYGLDAGDIKRIMAGAWQDVLSEKAQLGAQTLLQS